MRVFAFVIISALHAPLASASDADQPTRSVSGSWVQVEEGSATTAVDYGLRASGSNTIVLVVQNCTSQAFLVGFRDGFIRVGDSALVRITPVSHCAQILAPRGADPASSFRAEFVCRKPSSDLRDATDVRIFIGCVPLADVLDIGGADYPTVLGLLRAREECIRFTKQAAKVTAEQGQPLRMESTPSSTQTDNPIN